MLHLTAERLAALADELPTEIEAAHLSACPRCCRERDAQVRLRQLARAELERPIMPLTTWAGIEEALRASNEGALPAASSRLPGPTTPKRWMGKPAADRWAGLSRSPFFHRARQLVAASTLLAAGLAAGRYTAAAGPLALAARADTVVVEVPTTVAQLPESPASFASTSEALAALTRAERQYQLAASYLAAYDTTGQSAEDSPAVYRARLAALDAVMEATRTALYEAPQDPVINQYYLATIGARELAVRQLNTALPPGQSVSEF